MSYRPPEPGQKSRYVRENFDRIASHYDLFNDLITQGQHRRWKRVLVRRIGIPPAGRGLDLFCGTGDIAQRSQARLSGEGVLVAADFSANMLAIARERLKSEGGEPDGPGRPRTLLVCSDALQLPFPDASFDFVTAGYGLRNVSDLPGCLRELARVIRPGGVLATLDIGKVTNRWLRPLADFYLFRVVPRIGNLLQSGQEMYQYLPHSTLTFPSQEVLRQMMMEQGFSKVELVEFLFGASVIHLAHRQSGGP